MTVEIIQGDCCEAPIGIVAIPGFDGYGAMVDGTIWSRRNRWRNTRWHRLKPHVNNRNGYCYVALCRDTKQCTRTVHALIMLTFCGPRPNGMQVRHLNGIRSDSRLANLRYGTSKENQEDKIGHGTQISGEQVHSAKLTAAIVRDIRAKALSGISLASLGREYKVTTGNINTIVHRKSWKHI